MPYKSRIGGLSATATESSLDQMFSPFGTVLSAQVVAEEPPPDSGEVRTYGQTCGGEVTFEEDSAADRAVQEMNGKVVDGNTLTVAADAGG